MMKQVTKINFNKYVGSSMDFIFSGPELALKAWGKEIKKENSGLLAFPYLWRRFGPPFHGCDDYKDIVQYWLTTDNPSVILGLRLNTSLEFSANYLITKELIEECNKPF